MPNSVVMLFRASAVALATHILLVMSPGCNKNEPNEPTAPPPTEPVPKPLEERIGQLKLVRGIAVPTGAPGKAFDLRPDGREYVVGGSDGAVLLVPREGGQPRIFAGHRESVTTARYTPDGQTLVTAGSDNRLLVWDVATGTIRHDKKAARGDILSLAISTDGSQAAVGSAANDISVWRLADGERVHLFEGHSHDVTAVAWSADGRHVFSGSNDSQVRRWSVETGRTDGRPLAFRSSLTALAWSADRKVLYALASNGELASLDPQEHKVLHRKQLAMGRVNALAVGPRGIVAVGGKNGTVSMWSAGAKGIEPMLQPFATHEGAVKRLRFDRAGVLASLGGDDTIAFWDTSTADAASARQTLPPINGQVRAIAADPTSTRFAIASQGRLYLGDAMNASAGTTTPDLGPGGLSALSWTPDGQSILVGRDNGEVLLLPRSGGSPTRRTQSVPGVSVRHIQPSGDGKSIWVAGDDIALRRYDTATLKQTKELTHHTSHIIAMDLDPQGRWLASTEENRITFIIDLEDDGKHWTRRGHVITQVCFSPDGKVLLMVENNRELMLYDVADRRELKLFRTNVSSITAVQWSANAELLLTLEEQGILRVWDAKKGSQLASADAGRGIPRSLAMMDGGKLVLTGGMDPFGSAKVFRFAPPQ